VLDIPVDLHDLRRLALPDQDKFVSAATESEQKSWVYFFPFLYSFSLSDNRALLWEDRKGSICLYILRRRADELQFNMYVPPFPFNPGALKEAFDRANSFNGNRSARIVWVDERQQRLVESEGFPTSQRGQEYIYESALVGSASGRQFERLRRKVNKLHRVPGLQVRAYRQEDAASCRKLLRRWRRFLSQEKERVFSGYWYTRNGLDHASSFHNDLLRGEVVTVDERICAFSFYGKISASYGCIFITISDHAVPGLGFLQRQSLMANNPDIPYFNDSTDGGEPGLAEVKRSFNPIEMHSLYRAVQAGAGRRTAHRPAGMSRADKTAMAVTVPGGIPGTQIGPSGAATASGSNLTHEST
jgi:hypothetical protein